MWVNMGALVVGATASGIDTAAVAAEAGPCLSSCRSSSSDGADRRDDPAETDDGATEVEDGFDPAEPLGLTLRCLPAALTDGAGGAVDWDGEPDMRGGVWWYVGRSSSVGG